MKVNQVPNEPTRYLVESSTLECPLCKKHFNLRETKNKLLGSGSECPKCLEARERVRTNEVGLLQMRHHLVDLANFQPIGECQCEHFQFRLKAEVQKFSPLQLAELSQGAQSKLRCTHIEAARTLAINLTLRMHEAARHRNAYGQREGVGA